MGQPECRFTLFQVGKESACNAGDLGLTPGSGRSPGGGHGNPLQYSCLEDPMDRGAWRATVRGVTRVGHDLETKPPPKWKDAAAGRKMGRKKGDGGRQAREKRAEH